MVASCEAEGSGVSGCCDAEGSWVGGCSEAGRSSVTASCEVRFVHANEKNGPICATLIHLY